MTKLGCQDIGRVISVECCKFAQVIWDVSPKSCENLCNIRLESGYGEIKVGDVVTKLEYHEHHELGTVSSIDWDEVAQVSWDSSSNSSEHLSQ